MSESKAPGIMVIGAHAADAELMGGGAILAHGRQGWRSAIVHLTLGEKGHKSLDASTYAEIKRSEAEKAASVLGSECHILPFVDGELPVSEDVQSAIADLVRGFRPNVIVTHWKGSVHRDHINCYENVLASMLLTGINTDMQEQPAHNPSALFFGENWEDEDGFAAEMYLDISRDWDTYQEAVTSYGLVRGEAASFRYTQWYDGMSKARGAEQGLDRAVALMPQQTMHSQRTKVDRLA